jgi:hypothetical protein
LEKSAAKPHFSSQEALANYLRQHPKADASKHSVEKSERPSTQQSKPQSLTSTTPALATQSPSKSPQSTEADAASKRAENKNDPRLHRQAAMEHGRALIGARAQNDKAAIEYHERKQAEHTAKTGELIRADNERIEAQRKLATPPSSPSVRPTPAASPAEKPRRIGVEGGIADIRSGEAIRANTPEAHERAALAHKTDQSTARDAGDKKSVKYHRLSEEFHKAEAERLRAESERLRGVSSQSLPLRRRSLLYRRLVICR